MLDLKKFAADISDPQIPPVVHAEMNKLLTFLVGKKDFDFYQLGIQLSTAGPLGKDIVVCKI